MTKQKLVEAIQAVLGARPTDDSDEKYSYELVSLMVSNAIKDLLNHRDYEHSLSNMSYPRDCTIIEQNGKWISELPYEMALSGKGISSIIGLETGTIYGVRTSASHNFMQGILRANSPAGVYGDRNILYWSKKPNDTTFSVSYVSDFDSVDDGDEVFLDGREQLVIDLVQSRLMTRIQTVEEQVNDGQIDNNNRR